MEIIIILLVVACLVVSFIRRSPSYQGKIGENQVAIILGRLPREYQVINNIIIPNRQTTAQIDHIVVSPYGVFVIETKNYKGWIFGAEGSDTWKETFKTTGGNYFRNPIKQNWGHVYALSELLNLNRKVFIPVIVFSDKANLNVESTVPVIHMAQLKRCILSYSQEVLTPKEASTIANSIKKANLAETDIGKRHSQSVKESIEDQKQALLSGKCPRCGGDLVIRNGKYGTFYGCSNYPKCRFTHKTR